MDQEKEKEKEKIIEKEEIDRLIPVQEILYDKKTIYSLEGVSTIQYELAFYIGQQGESKEREGYGLMIWNDGSIYTGKWEEDIAQGYGKLTHADGDIYEGMWSDNMANGYGTFKNKLGGLYKGEWKNDK
jgi:hypothetical protein